MNMLGFESVAESDCINLLFKSWTLDSEGKFAAAVIGTFLLAILVELLTYIRREKVAASPKLLRLPRRRRAVMGALYLTQVTFGYFLMLIAMTYSAELFIAVILGLFVGHVVFNIDAPVAEGVEKCCVQAEKPHPANTMHVNEPTTKASATLPPCCAEAQKAKNGVVTDSRAVTDDSNKAGSSSPETSS